MSDIERDLSKASGKMPAGIGNILVNEAAERFSYYGMMAILAVFMTDYLLGADGQIEGMTETAAKKYVAAFKAVNYGVCIIGALLADIWLAKYRTIIWFSIVNCIGFFFLAFDQTRTGLFVGLCLIAIGSGVIKPCVSANVGDQFDKTNKHLLSRVYSWFYFAINTGAVLSMIAAPLIRKYFSPKIAFICSGGLMTFATIVFWMGRKKYTIIPAGGKNYLKETFSKEGMTALAKLCILLPFVAIFWSLFDQTMFTWVLQAKKMDLHLFGYNILPDQLTSINSLFILLFIPVFDIFIYPSMNKVWKLTPLKKICIGMFIGSVAFIISAVIEQWIVNGSQPSCWWQILAYVFITAGEIMISITYLEFSYTQAPKTMKSFVMSMYLMSIALGNGFTYLVNQAIEMNPKFEKLLEGAGYYWFFVWMMLATAVGFIFVVKFYKEKSYVGDLDSQP